MAEAVMYDKITITLKSGVQQVLHMEQETSRKVMESVFDKIHAPRSKKPEFVRIEGSVFTPLILSVVHMTDLDEIASIEILEDPAVTYVARGDAMPVDVEAVAAGAPVLAQSLAPGVPTVPSASCETYTRLPGESAQAFQSRVAEGLVSNEIGAK